MSSGGRTEIGKRSIFDIDLNESLLQPEVTAKQLKVESLQKDGNPHSSKSPIFDDDGFENLDLSMAEAECIKPSSQEDTNLASQKENDDVLTQQQKERAEKNRQKALNLKKGKLISRPDSEKRQKECFLTGESLESQFLASQPTEKKTIDTRAGFFIEEEEDLDER